MGSTSPADTVYRTGNVALSDVLTAPDNNRLAITSKYYSTNNKAAYFALNQFLPGFDSTKLGLASTSEANFSVLVANHYANFKSGITFSDKHSSAGEFNFNRGGPEAYGFRDGGTLSKAAAVRVTGGFGNNGRPYTTTDFDLVNLRLQTSTVSENAASITNFYAIRMENIQGVNSGIVQNGWGVFMQPSQLKNYFAGKTGIGTTAVTHALTVHASEDPVKFSGIQKAVDKELLGIDTEGVLHKQSFQDSHHQFFVTSSNQTLTDDYYLYIHKDGNAVFTLPDPSTRTGKTWKIVNIGTGVITLSQAFWEGDQERVTISSKSGADAYTIFSDGSTYIAIP